MLLSKLQLIFSRNRRYILLVAPILLFISLHSDVTAAAVDDKYYLILEHNKSTDKNDLDITSIGMLSLKDNKAGYVKLSHMKSESNGNGTTLDLGGGYAFNGGISFYLMLGVALGYNWDNDDYIAAYFPEVGIVLDISKTFGITVSGKRYYNLYEKDEDVVMLGLVFRK